MAVRRKPWLKKAKVKGEQVEIYDPSSGQAEKPRKRGRNPETDIQEQIRYALNLIGVPVFRNNVGVARHGRRYVRYGVGGKGGSDLLGMVRLKDGIGRWLALEVKVPGEEATPDQLEFLKVINWNGGYGVVVTCVDDAVAAVEACKSGVML